jgi:RHS repeat-associated protein
VRPPHRGRQVRFRRSAFGATRFAGGAPGTDYRYTGQRELSEIGLYYYRARWYDSALGRFVQPDTIVPGAAQPAEWDRYAYVSNNPLTYSDPSGHRPCSEQWTCEGPAPRRPPLRRRAQSWKRSISPLSTLWRGNGNDFGSSHHGVDYQPPTDDRSVRTTWSGQVLVADTCSAGNCVDQVGHHEPALNYGYGNVAVVEYPYSNIPENARRVLGLREDQSVFMLYAHLPGPPGVGAGETVAQGQTIGTVGSTGNSTADHPHFEIRIGSTGGLPPG